MITDDDVEIVLGAGIDPGKDEHRFAGKRQPEALEPNDDSDHNEAVVVNEMGDEMRQGGLQTKGRRALRWPTL